MPLIPAEYAPQALGLCAVAVGGCAALAFRYRLRQPGLMLTASAVLLALGAAVV